MEKEEIKRQIITNYLNSINLGSNTLGVKTAASQGIYGTGQRDRNGDMQKIRQESDSGLV